MPLVLQAKTLNYNFHEDPLVGEFKEWITLSNK